MLNILISNFVTAALVGGGILAYHLYRKRQEAIYYQTLKNKINDVATALLWVTMYYMVLQGLMTLSQMQNLIKASKLQKPAAVGLFEQFAPQVGLNLNGPQFAHMGLSPYEPQFTAPADLGIDIDTFINNHKKPATPKKKEEQEKVIIEEQPVDGFSIHI